MFSCASWLSVCQCLWKDNLSINNVRIIKSINTANLLTVSVQEGLLTSAAIIWFSILKAKCSYCICQTKQEKPRSLSVNGGIHRGSQHVPPIPQFWKALQSYRETLGLNPVWNPPVCTQMLLLGKSKQIYLYPDQNTCIKPKIILMTFGRFGARVFLSKKVLHFF